MSLKAFEKNLALARLLSFEGPEKVIFGIHAVENLCQEVRRLQGKSIFVIADENLVGMGTVQRVLEPLTSEKLTTRMFEVSGEPTTDSLREAVRPAFQAIPALRARQWNTSGLFSLSPL